MKSAYSLNKRRILELSALLFLAGCAGGTETNPVKKYDDLIKGSVAGDQTTETPSQLSSAYSIKFIKNTNEKGEAPELNFVEGKESSYSFKVVVNDKVFVKDATYKVNPIGLPAGATFTQDPKDKEQYILKWKPNFATVNSAQKSTSLKFALEVTDIKSPNNETAAYLAKVITKSENYSLNVMVDEKSPTVSGVVGLMDEYVEGKTYDISMTVSDLGGHPSLLPSLLKVNRTYDCKENQCFVDAAQYLNLTKVEDLKNGQWKVTIQLNLVQKALEFGSAANKLNAKGQEGVGFDLSFKIVGGRRDLSNTVSKKGFIVFKSEAQKPKLSLPDQYVLPVATNYKGTASTYSINASVDSNRGQLAIDEDGLKAAVTAISSNNKVSCKYTGLNKLTQVCNLTFDFACGVNKTFPIVVKAVHNVNGGTQTSETNLRIQVSEGADCKKIADDKKVDSANKDSIQKVALLKPKFSAPDQFVVPVGTNYKNTAATFSLTSFVESDRGNVVIDEAALSKALLAMSASNKVSCKYTGSFKSSQVCNMTFDFKCGISHTFPLQIKATNSVNGSVQTSLTNLRISVSEGSDCKSVAEQNKLARDAAARIAANKLAAEKAAAAKAKADADAKAKAAAKAKADAEAKKLGKPVVPTQTKPVVPNTTPSNPASTPGA